MSDAQHSLHWAIAALVSLRNALLAPAAARSVEETPGASDALPSDCRCPHREVCERAGCYFVSLDRRLLYSLGAAGTADDPENRDTRQFSTGAIFVRITAAEQASLRRLAAARASLEETTAPSPMGAVEVTHALEDLHRLGHRVGGCCTGIGSGGSPASAGDKPACSRCHGAGYITIPCPGPSASAAVVLPSEIQQTHHADCYATKGHHACAIEEVKRLRAAVGTTEER